MEPGGGAAPPSMSPRAAAQSAFAALAARAWSRVGQFADQPSLFAIALLLDLAFALVPSGLLMPRRPSHDDLACPRADLARQRSSGAVEQGVGA